LGRAESAQGTRSRRRVGLSDNRVTLRHHNALSVVCADVNVRTRASRSEAGTARAAGLVCVAHVTVLLICGGLELSAATRSSETKDELYGLFYGFIGCGVMTTYGHVMMP